MRDGKMGNTYCDYYLYGMTRTGYYETEGMTQPPKGKKSTIIVMCESPAC